MTLLGSLPKKFRKPLSPLSKLEWMELAWIMSSKQLSHEEMKQSELSGQLLEAESALTGGLRERYAHAISQHVLDAVLWAMFAVIVHVISLHVLDAAMWAHVRRYCPKKFKWHKAKMAESDEAPTEKF